MTQTTNYKLNQWAPEDRILRENFNADNQKIDAALAGAASGLAQERTDRANAVTGAKNEAAAAVAAEKKAREAADTAEKKAREQAVAAVPFVKLADIITSADAGQVDIDMSAWPLKDYAEIIVIPQLKVSSEDSEYSVKLRCNGASGSNAYYFDGNNNHLFLLHYTSSSASAAILRFLTSTSDEIYLHGSRSAFTGPSTIVEGTYICGVKPATLKASQWKTLNLCANLNNVDNKIMAGSKILIYGVKV